MATLGDVLMAARRSAGGFERWLHEVDPELGGRAVAAAFAEGLSITGYARMAVADFSRLASEEDWTTLVSSLRDSSDPGSTCLAAMVHWRLVAATCTAHSHHPMKGTADGQLEH